MNKDNW